MTYSEKLKNPRWQAKRKKITQRDGFRCRRCGGNKNLQVHHLEYPRGADPWECPDESLVTICRSCHERIEAVVKRVRVLSFIDLRFFEKCLALQYAAEPYRDIFKASLNSIHSTMSEAK